MTLHTPNLDRRFSLEELGLVDAPVEEAFDNLTKLASQLLGAPVSLVSIVQSKRDRQYFKAHLGLPEEWAKKRQTPLSHSFCQYVVAQDAPLVVGDATSHPMLCTNKAIEDLNVVAYLGVPVHHPADTPIGALCVIEGKKRQWSEADKTKLSQLGACLDDLIQLRASLKTSEGLRQEQEEFTYAISHDLKSPTNTMQLLQAELEEALDEHADEEARILLEHMNETASRMGELVDGVLGYTQLAGEEIETEPVSLREIVDGVMRDSKGYIKSYRAHITISELPMLLGNALQLRVLFQNLICNALKFRNAEVDPEIAIFAEPADESSKIKICVQDNGIGISKENHDRVFKLFQRLNLTEEYPGTGLGLALCKRIVANHGGTIGIRSEEGEGATFMVSLPVAQ